MKRFCLTIILMALALMTASCGTDTPVNPVADFDSMSAEKRGVMIEHTAEYLTGLSDEIKTMPFKQVTIAGLKLHGDYRTITPDGWPSDIIFSIKIKDVGGFPVTEAVQDVQFYFPDWPALPGDGPFSENYPDLLVVKWEDIPVLYDRIEIGLSRAPWQNEHQTFHVYDLDTELNFMVPQGGFTMNPFPLPDPVAAFTLTENFGQYARATGSRTKVVEPKEIPGLY